MFKASGIIRRIDDFGRVNIPSEIRRRYHLKEGDPVEFGENTYTIELRKYSTIDKFCEQTKAIAYAFAINMSVPVILCDTFKVIASKNLPNYEEKLISEELYQCMEEANVFDKSNSILKEEEVKADEIIWIRKSGNIIGALIIPKGYTDDIKEHAECLNVCAKAIGMIEG